MRLSVIVISVVLIVGIGFLYVNGIIEINEKNIDKTIQNIPQNIQETTTTAKDIATKTSDTIQETITNQIESTSENLDVNLSESELQERAVDWNYNDILRNFEKYKGKIIHIVGPIHRTDEISGDRFGFLVLSNKPMVGLHEYIMVEQTGKRFLDEDKIEIYGTVEEISVLPTLFGAEKLMPVVKAIKINCLSCP